MNTEERRQKLLQCLESASRPVTGAALAKELGVSRQIIVGDIGIIRAMGKNIYATPRGYIIPQERRGQAGIIATITCRHDAAGLKDELEIIVDNGGRVLDVIVLHPLYGEIHGDLMISTRYDVESFIDKMQTCKATPLLVVTGGVHLHTLEIPNEKILARIQDKLREYGILVEENEP